MAGCSWWKCAITPRCATSTRIWAASGCSKTPTATADRKSTRLNSSHSQISYAVFCLKKKNVYSSDQKSPRLNSTHNQMTYTAFCLKKKVQRLLSINVLLKHAMYTDYSQVVRHHSIPCS